VGAELDVKEVEFFKMEQRRTFYELQYSSLGEHRIALMKKGIGLTQHPHPFCNKDVQLANGRNFIKISPCVICLHGFAHNDIVVSIYKHLYHPWCALIHFGHNSQCTNSNCKTIMSPEWSKSLGYKEFGKDMYKKEILEGCEEAHLYETQFEG
jgi:hypothetical protein